MTFAAEPPEHPRFARAALDRRSFLALSAIVLAGCSNEGSGDESATDGPAVETPTSSTSENATDAGTSIREVIVIGAGPAGMTAAHRLRQSGVDVEVLEAASTHGGRIQHDLDFADFPISLGGEWVHVEAEVLDEIVADDAVDVATELQGYEDSDEVAFVQGAHVSYRPNALVFENDLKFVGSSWLDFFDTYVMPGVADLITFDTQVVAIDHRDGVVRITDAVGTVREAEKAVVTVPLKILQDRVIDFQPPLSDDRLEAIEEATVWSGFKAFIEFGEKFYPATVAFDDADTDDGQRLYYDAAYGQTTGEHVLGLFSVGAQAERYQELSDEELLATMLAELDGAFDGAASRSYVQHISQNWNDEPFARAAYLEDNAPPWITKTLAPSIDDRVYFAGDAYTSFDDWSSVHTAARSAAEAVAEILDAS